MQSDPGAAQRLPQVRPAALLPHCNSGGCAPQTLPCAAWSPDGQLWSADGALLAVSLHIGDNPEGAGYLQPGFRCARSVDLPTPVGIDSWGRIKARLRP